METLTNTLYESDQTTLHCSNLFHKYPSHLKQEVFQGCADYAPAFWTHPRYSLPVSPFKPCRVLDVVYTNQILSHLSSFCTFSYLSLVWPSQHSLLGWLNQLLTSSNSRLRNHSQIPPFMYLQSWIPDLLLLILFCKHTWPSYILHFYLLINVFTCQQNANCSQFCLQYMVTVLSDDGRSWYGISTCEISVKGMSDGSQWYG